MEKEKLKEIIIDQNKPIGEEVIEREIYKEILENKNNPFIIIITGIRRSGKSTLLKQIKEVIPGYYLNFDDDRLVEFQIQDFQLLYETLIELYGEKEVFYFDEIQNIKGWERFVRRLHNSKEKVFVTGSNSSMLSKELGTHLTGRNIMINLYPFSFREYLKLLKVNYSEKSLYEIKEKIKIKKLFNNYLVEGGMPEYLLTKNKDYLKNLYENILYKDIIVRYNLSNEKAMKELVYLAVNNFSKEISFNSFKKSLGLGSSTTVKEYFGYLENSFLFFLVPKYDYSLKRQIHSNKKLYVADNALAINLGFSFSKNLGKILENLVFLELKRMNKEIFYYQGKNECDFLCREGAKITQAVQVCYELNKENREREIMGLVEALKKFEIKRGLILTMDQEENLELEGKKIMIKPVWKWLLQDSKEGKQRFK